MHPIHLPLAARLPLAALLIFATSLPAAAQTTWAPWHQPSLLEPQTRNQVAAPAPKAIAAPKAKQAKPAPVLAASARLAPVAAVRQPLSAPTSLTDPDDLDDAPAGPAAPVILSGGPRPDITRRPPAQVTYASGHAPGTVVIDSAARRLFLIQSGGTALSYPVSVGREGFAWNGTEKISRVADWPDWHPPAEMRERDPKLPNKMTGGLNNPLGAKALYLGNSLYRIHGTSDGRSVGRAASSGCFRMHNGHVVDLASRIGVGTRVVVKNAPYASTVQAATAIAPPRPAAPRIVARP